MTLTLSSRLTAVLLPAVFLAAAMPAPAQGQPLQQQMAPQSPQQANNVCTRLEAQLQAFERSGPDQARTEQIKKYETAAAQQQAQLDRLNAQAKKAGCEGGGFFSIFSNQSASCGPLNGQIQQMKGNLDRINGDLARLQGSDPAPEREGQRRALIGALSQNDCGPQYRQAAAQPPQRGGLFESLFGAGSVVGNTTVQGENTPAGSGYRTVCVRMCDGYYYPISYSAGPNKFPDDEKTCQASCPAAEAQLFTHRNPGEDINHAVSQGGQPYTAIPNAFRYRQSFDNACTCKGGASQALKDGQDPPPQGGDVIVSEERAKQMSQPRLDAQGKPIKLELPPRPAKPDPKAAATPAAPDVPETKADDAPVKVTRDPNKPVRQVGPTFIAR
ncbi:MAG TPA: DUF2865 domain-containing protein [Xanthobacteraceae bacterium]|nr:DUF2865 domain-containing protein [Xanthobacteraceae bacterium]